MRKLLRLFDPTVIPSYIPGTNAFKGRHEQNALAKAQKKLSELLEGLSSDSPLKRDERMQKFLGFCLFEIERINSFKGDIFDFFKDLYIKGWPFFVFISLTCSTALLDVKDPSLIYDVFALPYELLILHVGILLCAGILLTMASGLLLIFTVKMIRFSLNLLLNRNAEFGLLLLISIFWIQICSYILQNANDQSSVILFQISFMPATFTTLTLLLSILEQFSCTAFDEYKYYYCADCFIVHQFIEILLCIQEIPCGWGKAGLTNKISSSLEKIAICIQRGFPRRLRGGEPETMAWYKEQTLEAATAVRHLKRWILMPKGDTRRHFISQIEHYLYCFVSGELDLLSRKKPQNQPNIYQSQLLYLTRLLLKLIFPFLLFFIFQTSPLSIEGELAEYISVGIFILSLVILLIEVDPELNEKLNVLDIFKLKL